MSGWGIPIAKEFLVITIFVDRILQGPKPISLKMSFIYFAFNAFG